MTDQLPEVRADRAVAAVTPMAILAQAVSEGKIDAESLKVIAELAWRDQDRNARNAFNSALATFQTECPPIRKTKDGPSLAKDGSGRPSYRYAPLDEIAKIVRPLLLKRGLTFTWDSTTDGQTITVTCVLSHVDGHERRSSFACPTDSPSPRMTGQQKHGGGLSFAQRRSLVSVLGLTTTDEDIDGADPGDEETITPEQAAELQAWAESVGADMPRFLAYLRVGSLSDLPASRVETARAALRKKGAAS
jgi:hypothetical protein